MVFAKWNWQSCTGSPSASICSANQRFPSQTTATTVKPVACRCASPARYASLVSSSTNVQKRFCRRFQQRNTMTPNVLKYVVSSTSTTGMLAEVRTTIFLRPASLRSTRCSCRGERPSSTERLASVARRRAYVFQSARLRAAGFFLPLKVFVQA